MTPLSADQEEQLAGVLEEYLDALEAGETPSVETLAADRPGLAEALPEYLDGLRFVHEAVHTSSQVWPDEASGKPKRLGEFELLQEIGRGGMGVVYEARQESLNRRVALKVLPFAAVLDERQIARFRTEAQAAASLHHPHIVPVYAVGVERGVHFYAMQFIEGRPLTRVIDELRVDREADRDAPTVDLAEVGDDSGRLASAVGPGLEESRGVARIGAQAAEALEHAHRYGVVHRDIKPSNLLIDAEGDVWVTDFGLAQVHSEASLTRPGDVLGTPQYMSPEQAEGRGDRIDGRTDVYSLGTTLYELLTLRPAHEAKIPAARREPRRIDRLAPGVPKDLRTIVHRALEIDRDDRYASAGEMAADLRRFLQGEPIVARSPGVAERLGRWVARHKRTAAAIGAVVTLFAVVSGGSAVWIASLLAESRASQALAESHYRQARTVVDRFGGDLSDRLARLPGAERIRRELLGDTLLYYGHFLTTAGDDPALTDEVAATHFKSAAVAERLTDLDGALASYEAAVAAWREATRPESRARLAVGLANLARVEAARGRDGVADTHYREAIAIETGLAGADPESPRRLHALAETQTNHGLLLCRTGRVAEGVASIRAAIDGLEVALSLDPSDPRGARNLALACNSLCNTLRSTEPSEAAAACDRALAVMAGLAADGAPESGYATDLAMLQNNRAALAADQGEWRRAADGYGAAAATLARAVRLGPATAEDRRRLATAQSNRGLALARLGEPEESDAAFGAAAASLERLRNDYPDWKPAWLDGVSVHGNQGVARSEAARHAEAIASFTAGARLLEASPIRGGGPGARFLRRYFENYAEALRKAGREAEVAKVNALRDELLGRISPHESADDRT